jgi:glycosyltransferase involved in cell wall biosynthesis
MIGISASVMSSSTESPARSVRILWLSKGLGRGGAEQLLVSAAERIDRSRFQLEVAYVLPWKDALVPDFERLGVSTHCLGSSRAADVRWIPRLRSLVRQGRFDLVHTHMPLVATAARTVSRRSVRIIHTEHNTWEHYRFATRWGNRLTYPRNVAVIAVSHAVATSIKRCPTVRTWPTVHVIHHGAEAPALRSLAPEARMRARLALGLPQDALVVGSIGNFTPKKDHRTLLEATAKARESYGELRLVLVGSGPLEHELREIARSLGLAEWVLFAGSRDDAAQLLPAFDVFALSSRNEGLPIALLEAMAAGVPSVATSVGGVPEIITGGREGLLVPYGDADVLADALITMLSDPDFRNSAGAYAAQTSRRFDITQAVHEIETVYLEALASSPPRGRAELSNSYKTSP